MEQISNKNPINILSGKVIHGRGIGKLVGMPTANMEVLDESTLPPAGVYVTEILLDGRVHYGITNIGTRPTVDNDKEISVETHILNFNEEIYGKSIRIRLFGRLRSQQKFENFSMLLEQIRMDCIAVREFFGIGKAVSRLHMSAAKRQAMPLPPPRTLHWKDTPLWDGGRTILRKRKCFPSSSLLRKNQSRSMRCSKNR